MRHPRSGHRGMGFESHRPMSAPALGTRRPGSAKQNNPPTNRARPWDLMLLVAAGLVLVGQARVHSFIPVISGLRPALILTLLGLGLWLLDKERVRSPSLLIKQPMVKAGVFVLAWAIVGVPFSLSLGGSATFILEGLGRTVVVFLFLVAAVRSVHDVRRLMGVLALGTAVYSILAPVDRYTGGGATAYDPNDSAALLVSGIPLLLFFALHGRGTWIRVGAGLATLPVLAGVINSQSRGGFVALVAVLAFMLLMLKAVKPAIRIAVAVVISLAAVPFATPEYWERVESITQLDDGYGETGIGGRTNTWKRGLAYTWANPVTGLGVNMFPRQEGLVRGAAGFAARWRAAHSTWIGALAELGIPGFLAFVAMFALGIHTLWGVQRSSTKGSPGPRAPPELCAMGGFLLASLLGMMVAISFLSHAYTGLSWGLVAMVAGLAKVLPRSSANRGLGE